MGALDAFRMLEAKALLPIHWSTFQLGYHAWSDPAEVLIVEAEKRGVPVLTPLLGEPIEPGAPPVMRAWWRALPPIAARCRASQPASAVLEVLASILSLQDRC